MDSSVLEIAVETITQELEREPENARLYKERGRLRMMLGDKDGALQDLRKATRLDPTLLDSLTGNFKN